MKRASSHKEHMERLNLAVHMEDVTIAYDGKPAILGINLEIPSGVLMAVIGPNNAGKTTLLKAIMGLENTQAGSIYVFSRPAGALKNDIAYVPERTKVNWAFPTSVLDLVAMGSYNRKRSKSELNNLSTKEITEDALNKTGLYGIRKKSICDLSNGERGRALIARALVQDARIDLMDEPIIVSDKESEAIVTEVLDDLKHRGKTVVMAHHDVMTIPKYFDWVTFINIKKIASGQTCEIFNNDNISATYGRGGFLSVTNGLSS